MSSIEKSEDQILNPSDFESIRDAVMETSRGRWFLSEFASRLKSMETRGMLDSMRRLETAVAANHDALMSRLATALASDQPASAKPGPAQADLAPKHMKFFKQDEEIFEPAPQARIAAVPDVPRPEPSPKGAKVIFRRASEASLSIEPAPVPQTVEQQKPATPPAAEIPAIAMPEPAPQASVPAEVPQKRRIVIIRHKPGEDIDVPLQNEMSEAI